MFELGKLRKARWWSTVIVTTAILWLTLAPHPLPDNDARWFEGADKIVHALMFFALTCAAIFDFSLNGKKTGILKVFIISLCVAVFAALDEWAQGAMGLGRSKDIFDFIADCTGIIIAAFLCAAIIIINRP